jgi:hypothetical protein
MCHRETRYYIFLFYIFSGGVQECEIIVYLLELLCIEQGKKIFFSSIKKKQEEQNIFIPFEKSYQSKRNRIVCRFNIYQAFCKND